MADQQQPLSQDEFAAKIKAQYPAYASMDNAELTQKVLAKYPTYSTRVRIAPVDSSIVKPVEPSPLREAVTKGLDVMGGKKLGEFEQRHPLALPSAQIATGYEMGSAPIAGMVEDIISGAKSIAPGTKGLIRRTLEKLGGAEGDIAKATTERTAKEAENLSTFQQQATKAIQSNDQQALLAARKQALQRGVEELQPRLQQHIQDTHNVVRANLDKRWDAIRQAFAPVAGQPPILANPNAIAAGVRSTSAKVSGANTELFQRVVQDAFGESNPANMEWKDIQGVYTKLGSRLAKGGLPGDVWRSAKALQDTLGTEMETMANVRGVKADLQSVKADWSQYMEDFQNTRKAVAKGGSPLAHSLQSPDPGTAVKPFEGDAGDRATQTLSRYKKYGARPELAKKYRDVTEEAAKAAKGGKVSEMPRLKKETPVDVKAIKKEAASKAKKVISYGAAGALGAEGVYKAGKFLAPLFSSGQSAPGQ
jgi:hypothetical protein